MAADTPHREEPKRAGLLPQATSVTDLSDESCSGIIEPNERFELGAAALLITECDACLNSALGFELAQCERGALACVFYCKPCDTQINRA